MRTKKSKVSPNKMKKKAFGKLLGACFMLTWNASFITNLEPLHKAPSKLHHNPKYMEITK
jgi:hypothetical protein